MGLSHTWVCVHARYTLDTVSRSLVFDKTDASLLGCGSSAVVYKGMLDDRPVALKVDANSLGSSADRHRASPSACRCSSSKD